MRVGLWGFWEEEQRDKLSFPLHHIKDACYEYDITHEVNLDHLGKAVFARFIHCKVNYSSHPFHIEFFEKELL